MLFLQTKKVIFFNLFRFHVSRGDNYPTYNEADPRGLQVENLLGSLKDLNIAYFFGKINSSTDKMICEFRSVMKDEDFVREIDMQNPGNILAMAVQSVAMTIDARMTAIIGRYLFL